MRRLTIASAAIGVALVVAGCGSSSTSTVTASTAAPSSASTATSVPNNPTSKQATKPIDANPCRLVTAADLIAVFGKGSSFELVDTDNPPVTESFEQRACGYTGIIPGIYSDNPNNGTGTQITIMITTNVDNATGMAWDAAVEGAKQNAGGPNNIARSEYHPVSGIGDDAFFSGTGWLTAHKGHVIIDVQSPDDTAGVLTNKVAIAIMQRALSHVTES